MIAGWDVVLSPAADRDLRRLDPTTRRRTEEALHRLVGPEAHGDFRKLQGPAGDWRLRVGDWRIRVRLDAENRAVVVVRVAPRDRAYHG